MRNVVLEKKFNINKQIAFGSYSSSHPSYTPHCVYKQHHFTMGMLLKIELHVVVVSRLGIRGLSKWCRDRDVPGSLTNMRRLRRYGLWTDAS